MNSLCSSSIPQREGLGCLLKSSSQPAKQFESGVPVRSLESRRRSVYSKADAGSRVVHLADEAICTARREAQLFERAALIGAAQMTGADAFGMASFPKSLISLKSVRRTRSLLSGLNPMSWEVGDKALAQTGHERVACRSFQAPKTADSLDDADDIAQKLGFPIILKAVAEAAEGSPWSTAATIYPGSTRAQGPLLQQLFKDSRVYLEKFIPVFRHTEVQILCDNYGHGIHLGERDCSVQRRRQKLIEEAPSIHLNPEQRARMCETAVQGALAAGYSSAGTVEFILDPDGNFTLWKSTPGSRLNTRSRK